jgi:MFS family permease
MLFGVDIESITIIVSVFMFGLGLGGLLGGQIADRWPKQLLILYVFIELGIAAFGYASPNLIMQLGNVLITNSKLITAMACFLLLALPTLLMGATFPILVAHVNQHYCHVGHAVGHLYCTNTLGAAVGAFAAGFILLSFFDVFQSIHYAAISNLIIACIAYFIFQKTRPC